MKKPSQNLDIPQSTGVDVIHSVVSEILSKVPIPASTLFNLIFKSPLEIRHKNWMENVRDRLILLEEKEKGIINKLINDEEFISILIQVSPNAIKNHQDQKLELFRNAISNYPFVNYNFDFKISLISIADELKVPHILLLKRLNDGDWTFQKSFKEVHNSLSKFVELQDLKESETKYYLLDLSAKGLVSIVTNRVPGKSKPESLSLSDFDNKRYFFSIRITEIGQSFINYLLEGPG